MKLLLGGEESDFTQEEENLRDITKEELNDISNSIKINTHSISLIQKRKY